MRHAALIARDIKQTMELLDDNGKPPEYSEAVIKVPICKTADGGPKWLKELDTLPKRNYRVRRDGGLEL